MMTGGDAGGVRKDGAAAADRELASAWARLQAFDLTSGDRSRVRANEPAAEAEGALVVASPREDRRAGPGHDVFVVTPGGVVTRDVDDLDALKERAKTFAEASRAAATRAAYRTDWKHFEAWCTAHRIDALPAAPETVAAYLVDHADSLAVATLTRRISSIATAHRLAGYVFDTRSPALREPWRGIRRSRGTTPKQARALNTAMLRRMLATCGERLLDRRDRALLLVGFAAAFRRSEVCAFDVGDVTISPEGLTIRLARSKGDQEGEGALIAVGRTGTATCPAAAFEDWIKASKITAGRAFRGVDRHGRLGTSLSPRAVDQIVRARARAAGLGPEEIAGISAHSLRAGFATSAAAAGIEERLIMRQTRHASAAMVRRYIRDGERWQRNLAAEIGL